MRRRPMRVCHTGPLTALELLHRAEHVAKHAEGVPEVRQTVVHRDRAIGQRVGDDGLAHIQHAFVIRVCRRPGT